MAARTMPKGGMLREIMKQAMALASGGGVSHNMGELSNFASGVGVGGEWVWFIVWPLPFSAQIG